MHLRMINSLSVKQSTRLNVTIPAEYKEHLQELAAARGVSMSKAIREAIALWSLSGEKDRANKDIDFQIELLKAQKKP